MTIREQIALLRERGAEFVVVGGQAGVLRRAIEFSHDLDILIRTTQKNAERLRGAVQAITGVETDTETLLGRDFQQYVSPTDGTEIDVHLKLVEIPSYEAAMASSSVVDYLGMPTPCLELTALYASKRTDRPRDALHRRAIEDRLSEMLKAGDIEADETVLCCCLDAATASLAGVAARLPALASATAQPLLQTRLVALDDPGLMTRLASNPQLDEAARALIGLDAATRAKVVSVPGRLAALLSRLPLHLPPEGHRVQVRRPG